MTLESRKRALHPEGVRAFRYATVGRRAAWLLLMLVALPAQARTETDCRPALRPPVPGMILRPFAPADRGGHWGVDLASSEAAVVRAPVSGRVTYAGSVAGIRSVTVAPRSEVRVSISYLSEIWVTRGQRLKVGQPLGRSGIDHGISAVHLSLRVKGRYQDPRPALNCGAGPGPNGGRLKLLPHGSGAHQRVDH